MGNIKTGRRTQRTNKNLAVLTEFMNRYGLSTQALGRITGHDKTNYVIMLSKDDAKISTLERIFDAFGCQLDINIDYPDSILRIEGDAVTIPGVHNLRRLAAIDTEMRRQGLSKTDMAQLIKCNKINVINWFKVDDCLMSSLMAMCDALQVTPSFRLSSKKAPKSV